VEDYPQLGEFDRAFSDVVIEGSISRPIGSEVAI